MRADASRIGQTRRFSIMVEPQTLDSESGFASRLKNSFSTAAHGAGQLGDLPKNCHLLPSAAILEPQDRDDR